MDKKDKKMKAKIKKGTIPIRFRNSKHNKKVKTRQLDCQCQNSGTQPSQREEITDQCKYKNFRYFQIKNIYAFFAKNNWQENLKCIHQKPPNRSVKNTDS